MNLSEANFLLTYGFSIDIECRYQPDAEYLKTGRRPTDADYAVIPDSPDVSMMREGPLDDYEQYLGSLSKIREEHPILLQGEFRDTEGFTIENSELRTACYVQGDEMAVVVWNDTSNPQSFELSASGYTKSLELRPGKHNIDSGTLGPDCVAVLFFLKT